MRPGYFATSFALMATLGFFFACAGGEDKAEDPTPPPLPGQTIDAGESDAPDGEPPAIPRTCSSDGFCYVPVPGTKALSGVSASSADDAWMTTEQGSVLMRWDGSAINQVYEYDRANPPSIEFVGIWAEKKDDVWAVARGSDGKLVVVRYASPIGGGAPEFRELRTDAPFGAVAAIWGTPSSDAVWVTVDRTVLRVREDASGAVVEDLTPPPAPDANSYSWTAVWGFAPDDVYVGGKVCKELWCWDIAAVLAHYDGTAWSMKTLENEQELNTLRGTPPGMDRHLWYITSVRDQSGSFHGTTHLAPIESAGTLGAEVYSRAEDLPPPCGTRIGTPTTATTGWFSAATLLCRWNGTTLEPVRTALGDRPLISSLNGIWASGTDDVWIVGGAVTRSGLPQTPFAARRTAATAEEAKR